MSNKYTVLPYKTTVTIINKTYYLKNYIFMYIILKKLYNKL